MAILSWGKPRQFVKKNGDNTAKYKEFPAAVENSTQLTTTKGSKQEAKIEGGENEGVRYGKNTYALANEIRAIAGRKKPLKDDDGVIEGSYEVIVVPENPAAPALRIKESTASCEDKFTAQDGGSWVYTFDALKPEAGGNQLEWGTATVGADGQPSFTPLTPESEDGE